MFFPPDKEHTVKRIATTVAAAALLSLGASGVASAKGPASHSVRAKAAHHTVRSHVQRLGHGHHMV